MTDQRVGEIQAVAGADAVELPTFLPPKLRHQDSAAGAVRRSSPETSPAPEQGESARGEHGDADSVDVGPIEDVVMGEGGPSPASTDDAPPRVRPLVTAAQIDASARLVEVALMAATRLFNRRTATGPGDDRWLMSAQQRRGISRPFGRMLARRSPIPTGGENASDLADTVEGVVALIGYVIEQMTAERADLPRGMVAVEPVEVPAPAGPGATANPFDPASGVA